MKIAVAVTSDSAPPPLGTFTIGTGPLAETRRYVQEFSTAQGTGWEIDRRAAGMLGQVIQGQQPIINKGHRMAWPPGTPVSY
jgi:hypothetical protein